MAEFWEFMPDSGNAFFISYNSKDWQRIAPIAKALNDMGYPVWYDYGLEAGTQRWKEQISMSIDRCHAAIVFITKGIFDRERCYVLNEHDEAIGIKKVVVPVFLDSVNLSEVPPLYRAYVTDWNSMQGVPFRHEAPAQTAKRIADVIERSHKIRYKLPKPKEKDKKQEQQTVYTAPSPTKTAFNTNLYPTPTYASNNKVTVPVKKSNNKTWMIIASVAIVAAIICGAIFISKSSTGEITNNSTSRTTTTQSTEIQQTYNIIETSSTIKSLSEIKSVSVGDHFLFGNYPQNTDDPDPIEWRVLAKTNNKILIISEYLMDTQPYNLSFSPVHWETCTLREWLNNDFYNNAFSESDKNRILLTTNKNPNNPESGTNGGADTKDKLFCLSVDEADEYFSTIEDLKAAPTVYAMKHGASIYAESEYLIKNRMYTGIWWLRTPGSSTMCAVSISRMGQFGIGGPNVNENEIAVRPACWISI